MFDGLADDMTENELKLLYVYYFSQIDFAPDWTFSIDGLFAYLADFILNDPLFADFFENEDRNNLLKARRDLDDAIKKLSGPDYSLMSIVTTFPGGSDDTYMFLHNLIWEFDNKLAGKYFIIGNSPMMFETSLSFGGEYFLITLITAGVIFLITAFAFRSLIIPAILVLLIQGAIYLNVSIIGIQGYGIFFLALLIVQCILMCATIDYGILFTSYYREKRKTLGRKEALAASYYSSIYTILTSGIILIIVTGIVGMLFENPTIGQICRIISTGALCATILIVFVLPGIIATCDRWIHKDLRYCLSKKAQKYGNV